MKNAILRFAAIFIVTIKRIFAQRGLALAVSLGIISAVALAMSIPIYSDAVYQNILENKITTDTSSSITGVRPPFAFMYRYVGAWSGTIPYSKIGPSDTYFSGPVVNDIGLKPETFVRYLKTDNFRLFSSDTGTYSSKVDPLAYTYFSVLSDFEKHIQLVDGSMPAVAAPGADSVIDVLVSEALATKLGVQTGDRYNVFTTINNGQTTTVVVYPARVSGVWKASDPKDPYWFYNASEFDEGLMVPEKTFTGRILPYINDQLYLGVWYWVLDGSKVQSADVPGLIDRITGTRQKMTNMLPNMRLDISPEDALWKYRSSAQALTIFLYAFSIPLLLMIFIFIGLVVDMAVSQRRNEIAVLRSRGSTILQVLGMAALEGLLLGMVGLLIGTPLAQVVAQFFGKSQSFLNFSAQTNLQTSVTLSALRFGLVTVGIALVAQVMPTLSAAKHTVITYKQDRARQSRAPWWQRAWLDVLLFIPAAYGTYLLRQGGASGIGNDPFQNPLLLLVPALGIFSLTLLLLRLLPLFMSVVAWLAARTNSVGILMAARYLSRTAGGYSAPLILLIMTLSLSTFTATLAQTLDRHMSDQTNYKVGGDVNLMEIGDTTTNPVSAATTAASTDQSSGSSNISLPTASGADTHWVFLPVEDHLKISGVTDATRVGTADIRLLTGGSGADASYMGIDRVDFTRVAFWRRDFAQESLGALMNNLGLTSEGVLVSRDLLASRNLRVGDALRISTYQFGENKEIDLKIVGAFDYFPTWYPDKGPLVVGNLDYFFEAVGGEFPYEVWLKIAPKSDYPKMVQDINNLYHRVLGVQIAPLLLTAEQLRPERQGFFGLLSVGFLALAFLTVLGFLLYAFFSFRRRFIELGMLRAIGLSSGQMLIFLASELAFLFLTGLAAGTGLGVLVSNLFIPSLQVGNDLSARIPPFLVRIDWSSVFQIYALFGVLFVVALSILGAMLVRMKIFQAIKLGEAV